MKQLHEAKSSISEVTTMQKVVYVYCFVQTITDKIYLLKKIIWMNLVYDQA
jgi:hypothetical protein